MVRCGCFYGTVEDFKTRVIQQKGDIFYLDFVDLAVRKIEKLKEK